MASGFPFPSPAHPHPKAGDPSWDLALMFPLQGGWTVENYLSLDTGLLVEYTDGFVRVLPMPTPLHQWIVKFILRLLDCHISERQLGEVFCAPLPVKLTETKYREPDVVFVRPERLTSLKGQPAGADLVVEVVSEGQEARNRDYVDKRTEYAAAGITEYWIVDPDQQKITVLFLDGESYREHGLFRQDEVATSALLEGFSVSVKEVFARCDPT